MEKRPDFETLASYEEFKKYYWYRKELSGICRRLGIEYRGTKQELNHHIEEYFCGKLAERKDVPRLSKKVSDIELHTPLLDCGFSFNAFFREYFAKQEVSVYGHGHYGGGMAESKEGRRQIVYHAGYAGCIPGEIGLCKV